MRFRVVWDQECFAQLDGLVAAGLNTDQLKNVVRFVANELATDPALKGHEIAEGLCRFDAPPLRIYFHIDPANQVVIVDGIAAW